MEFDKAKWLFPIIMTFHNLEEAIFLPAWLKSHSVLLKFTPPSPTAFSFAVLVITILAYLVTVICHRFGNIGFFLYLLLGFCFSMLVNAFIPHILASIVLKSYTPGVVTGILLNLPVAVYLIVAGFNELKISKKEFVLSSFGVTLVLMVLIPILFKLGEYWS